MPRLLVFGFCPLPFENTSKSFGPGIRAWQFIQPLLEQNIDITFVANRIPFIYPERMPPETVTNTHGFTYYSMSDRLFRDRQRIQDIHDRFQPDAILAATVFACAPLENLKTSSPIWIDLFGHVMAEAQAKAYRYQTNQHIDHFLRHQYLALRTGDKFSTVSRAQSFATIGELGLIKRLTASTTGYEFCHTIPCAMEPSLYQHDKKVFRGIDVPEDAFVVLWSGGFNTWTDIETLFEALQFAMAENPDIYFVSTGGQIDGHDEMTYPRFVKLVTHSSVSNRFLLKGWVPKADVHNYYFEADVGINIDRYMYEGVFGSKNRVLDWMRADLPALIGELCELSRELPEKGLAFSFPLGDPRALADCLLKLAGNRLEIKATGQKAREYALRHLTFDATTKPFQQWLRLPENAPDKNLLASESPIIDFQSDVSGNYIRDIEQALESKNRHIERLECYIRHLEDQFRKKSEHIHDSFNTRPRLENPRISLPEEPLVSVIIVAWNGMSDIDTCIQSVLTHDYQNLECLVIDNGSSDGTPEHIRQRYSEVLLIQNSKNRGFTAGVNQGILKSAGDVIFLLNQDAIMKPGLLSEIIHVLSDESVAVAGCKIYHPDGEILQHAGGIFHDNGLTDHYGAGEKDAGQFDEDRDVAYVTGAAFAFKKDLVQEIGIFDTRFSPAYFEELDYCIRASRAGYRIRYCHKATATHRESSSTGKFSRRFYYLYHRNRLKLILKHFPLRYFLGTFRRTEWRWLRHSAVKEQLLPLCRAYLHVTPRIFWLFFRDFHRKVFK
jgi:GT2 family glycosyltransferase/glycosyltransferase involved in cell wall biosynthesis